MKTTPKSKITISADIAEIMFGWNKIERAAKRRFPHANKEELYEITKGAMNYALQPGEMKGKKQHYPEIVAILHRREPATPKECPRCLGTGEGLPHESKDGHCGYCKDCGGTGYDVLSAVFGGIAIDRALLKRGWKVTREGMWLDYLGRGMWTWKQAIEMEKERLSKETGQQPLQDH